MHMEKECYESMVSLYPGRKEVKRQATPKSASAKRLRLRRTSEAAIIRSGSNFSYSIGKARLDSSVCAGCVRCFLEKAESVIAGIGRVNSGSHWLAAMRWASIIYKGMDGVIGFGNACFAILFEPSPLSQLSVDSTNPTSSGLSDNMLESPSKSPPAMQLQSPSADV